MSTTTRRPPFRRRGQNFLPLGPHVSLRADVTGSGGIVVGSATTNSFQHHQVASDLVIEVDWDNDGDFDEPEENITSDVLSGMCKTGRDWPSQLTGKAGPGQMRLLLRNDDDRYSYFNAASPLNTAPFSLKTGRKARVRVTEAENPDPVVLAKDRFGRASGSLGSSDNGLAWTNTLAATWVIDNQQAKTKLVYDSSGVLTDQIALATVQVGTADGYAQVTCPHNDGSNTVGIVYRYDDASNFGLVRWQGESALTEVSHYTVIGGVQTETFAGFIEHQDDTTFGVRVLGTEATIYVNGVELVSGTAYSSAATKWGIRGFGGEGRDPRIDDFYVWSGLAPTEEGILWTGDISELTASVSAGPEKLAELRGEGWLAKAANVDVDPPESIGITGLRPTFGVVNLDGQKMGELVGKALAKAGLLHPPGPIQRGDVLAGSVGIARSKALDVARQFEEAEFGFLYETQEGPIAFDARTARDASYSLVTFSDAPGTQFAYEAITPFDWRREVINEVTAGVSATPCTDGGTAFGGATNNAAGVDTNVTVTLPSATQMAIGQLLLVIITPSVGPATGQQWITPRDWVAFNGSQELGRARIYAKRVAAGDFGASVTFYNDIAPFGGSWASLILPVDLWFGDIASGVAVAQPVIATGSDASSGQVDCPVLFPPWGKETTYYLALRHGISTSGGFTISGTGPPNGYINFNSASNTGTVDAYDLGIERAFSSGNGEIEAPSRFTGTFTGFTYVETNLIALRGFNGTPPPAGSIQLVTVTDLDSQDEHNAVRSHRNAANLFRSKADARIYGELVLARHADDRPIFSMGFTATKSGSYRNQAIRRRVSDRMTLEADNQAGLGVAGDYFIESVTHEFSDGVTNWYSTWELSPADDVLRADTADSELGASITTDSTTMEIVTNEGPAWITSDVFPNMFPVAVRVDEEVIRLLSNTTDGDTTSPQTFNIERSVNGVTQAHDAAAGVSLADPWIVP